jgi:hypothetical protein
VGRGEKLGRVRTPAEREREREREERECARAE